MTIGLVVGEGAAPSRHANQAFSGAYKTPLHGWCYPPYCRVVLSDQSPYTTAYFTCYKRQSSPLPIPEGACAACDNGAMLASPRRLAPRKTK